MHSHPLSFKTALAAVGLFCCAPVFSAPVINEIFFRSTAIPEDTTQEWIELHNPDAAPVDLSGWKFSKGVNFTFPAATEIPAGGYLVVAANATSFNAAHPTFSGQLLSGWVGQLSNNGETIQLDDAAGLKVHSISYANEGDWATRVRGPLSFSHRGWVWESLADRGGSSLELIGLSFGINKALDNGLAWKASTVAGGTPGAANSVAAAHPELAMALDVRHKPDVPKSSDAIRIYAKLPPGLTNAVCRWRLDGAATFQTAAFAIDGAAGTATEFWDGVATIPAQANGAVVEYYVDPDSTNAASIDDTWPRQARTSNPGVLPETYDRVCNALIQVDDTFDATINFTVPGNQPIYRLIMTDAERAELATIGSTNGQEDSEAEMNGTFISHDGTGTSVRYRSSFRNRGFGSALGPPNNFHISFVEGEAWNGRRSLGINCQYIYAQALGEALFSRAGIATQEAAVVRLRVNGTNLAQTGNLQYGRYVRIEGRGSDWAANHYPNDPDGNFYRLDDHAYPTGDPASGEFSFEGTNPLNYADTFWKETNKEENDYSDLINFARIVSAPATGGTVDQPAISDAAYPASVATVLDLDQFYRFMATDALVGNQEGGLQSGRADDASIYRGVIDPRFRFIPHDLDDVFDIGNGAGSPVTRSLFSYNITSGGVTGLARLFNHPQLLPRYYSAVLEAMDTWFNRTTIDPIVDQIMQGWVPATDGNSAAPNSGIAEIKAYVDARRANVLGQIPQTYALTVTGNAADSLEGYKVTTTGAATIAGTFNVAKTYSITVNGVAAQLFYRTVGTDAVGSWKLITAAGGSGILSPGLNNVLVQFWDGINGTGNVLTTLQTKVLYQAAVPTYTDVSGTLTPPGSLAMLAPANYVPGVPFLVRVDLKDALGALNREAWNSTATLTGTNGVTITPSTVALVNGMGSALVSLGSTSGGGTVNYLTYGTGGSNGAVGVQVGTGGSTWKYKTDLTSATISSIPTTWKDPGFNDSSWPSGQSQIGYGDTDENLRVTKVDYNGATTGTPSGPAYLFRSTFTIADINQLASVTGQVKYDDAAIVYVNGTEVLRTAGFNTIANVPQVPLATYSDFGGAATQENATSNITVPLNLLTTGVNTIAVQVHQHDVDSSDMTFDLRLQGNLIATTTDPGNFTLTASVGTITAQKALTSAGSTPTMTNVSGTLPAGTTTWSGIMNVTGDVIVPNGATLQIAAGTTVLMAGTPGAGDTAGADIIVNAGGTLAINGTQASPVNISSNSPSGKWGQILLSGANPTVANFLLMSGGGHAPGVGHTSRGPMWRLTGANLSLLDSAMGDGPAKALYSSGTCDFVMQRSLMTRMITGPEVEDGCSILIEDSNIQDIMPTYRESNANVPDDEDCLYVHNSTGRPVNVRRSVFAKCGDDVFDCLAGPINVEDTILREGWDKGMSLLNNDLTMTRSMIVDCDKAIVPKSNSATTRSVVMDRCTIVSENHDTTLAPWGYSVPPSAPDADTPSTGLYTQNKAGQSNAGATLSIIAKDCIILAESPILVDAPYDPIHTVVTYSITRDTDTPATAAWTGTGNSNADPLFVSLASDDYHLQSSSPAINTGDPASTPDTDASRADMGALPFGTSLGGVGEVVWSLAGSPYRVTANTTVPANLTLRIDPGVAVYFDQGRRMTVNGRIIAQGTANRRITFSHVPGTNILTDVDPIKNGTQTGAPKWGGLRIYDSMAAENIISYCDFINAQGTSTAAPENYGSLGFIRSWGWVDHCTWSGTHLRMCYGRNSKLTVTYNDFPDMMVFDPVLGRVEDNTDFISAADNNMEPLKVEFPTGDPETSGVNAPNFPNGQPYGGHWRVYFNDFHGNRGHNDVFDADSGRWGQPGQFMLDCRYNWFHGLSGDEHIDLGGDAYIASNIFERATKDEWVSAFGTDNGYSNAISSGDKGSGTTIMVVRNTCFDLDHVINCKLSTATIFEHNTVANLHADYLYTPSTPDQAVKCAPINFFVPEDGSNPTYGDGAYMGFNLISNVPRLFSGADTRKINGTTLVNDVTQKIEFFHNMLDQVGDPTIGPNHPGGIFGGTYGVNTAGTPVFADPVGKDYSLAPGSSAKGAAPGGLDYGASIPEWAYILNAPPAQTPSTTASLTIGGPGVVTYKWRLDGGAWSAPIQIGSGGVLPRDVPTVRQSVLNLTGLTNGLHTLEVLGQDMAGNWQDADPARTFAGEPQFAPTSISWTVNSALQLLVINEIAANTIDGIDWIELYNAGSAALDLGSFTLTDNPLEPAKFTFAPGTMLAPGGYIQIPSTLSLLGLDKEGDTVQLYNTGVLVDSVTFGPQALNYTLNRTGLLPTSPFALGTPTPEAAAAFVQLGPPSELVISEWMAASDVHFGNDWVELHNGSTLPVSLTGLSLTDNQAGNAAQFTFPPYSFIAPDGYQIMIADGNAAAGPSHLPFSLDAQQETLVLLDGATVLDFAIFYPQTDDFSQAVNELGLPIFYGLPTYGFVNGTSDPGYANALAILNGLRITEIMYNANGGNSYDWIELRNVGPVTLNLEGVSFVQGITFTFGNVSLAPGDDILLVANTAAFESRYGGGLNIAGQYVGRLDNGGETLTYTLPSPWQANVLTFSYNDAWYPTTDGAGKSLDLISTLTVPRNFGDRDAWIASTPDGGTPDGRTIGVPSTYTQWLSYFTTVDGEDADSDGLGSLVEFGLGLNPLTGNAAEGAQSAPTPLVTVDQHLAISFALPLNVGVTDGYGQNEVTYRVEVSDNLQSLTWNTVATKTPTTQWSGTATVTPGAPANGYQPITVSDPALMPANARRFMRLTVVWNP